MSDVYLDPEKQRRLEMLIAQLPTELSKTAVAICIEEIMRTGKSETIGRILAQSGYETEPVSMRQFLEDRDYMGGIENLWPDLKQGLIDFFEGHYVEGVISGAIGTGKSVFSSFAFARMLYELSCLKDPAAYYNLIPGSTVYVVNQSINEKLAKKVIFTELKQRISQSPYFKERFFPDPKIESELHFPKNVIVMPLAAGDTSALGLNVFAAVIDEAAFLPVVLKSDRTHSVNDTYDAAERMYNAVSSRLTSRFMQAGGKIPGKILMVSSANYEDDFIERKKKEARTNPTIFVRERALWDVKPELLSSGKTFRVEIGGKSGRPRILAEGEEADADAREIINVPLDFLMEFQRDCITAVRNIAGRPTSAVDPFFPDISVLRDCVDKSRDHPFSAHQTTLTDGVRILIDKVARLNPSSGRMEPIHYPRAQRYAHIDYALSNDECGVAIGCSPGNIVVERPDMSSGSFVKVTAPIIHIDAVMRIVAPRGGQIDLEGVRALIIFGFLNLGFRIVQCMFDSFQSSEAQQQLRKYLINSDTLSVDKDMTPYLTMRQAAQERRLNYYEYAPLLEEGASLELDRVRMKVDHPPKKDKGLTDAVASVCEQVTLTASNNQYGLIEYLKNEDARIKAAKNEPPPQVRDASPDMLNKLQLEAAQKVETNENTPKCPECQSTSIRHIRGQSDYCSSCGHQFNFSAKTLNRPKGGRKDLFK